MPYSRTTTVTTGGRYIALGNACTAIVTQSILPSVEYPIAFVVILIKVLDLTIGLRVTQEAEIQGLDLAEHGEEGYIFN